jgi:glycosyltransferase involved in cell wall biosynthesis
VNILYVSLSYIPSRRASSIQVMKMCEAFTQVGHTVTLVAKRGDDGLVRGSDDFAFYGVTPRFETIKLPRPVRRGGDIVYVLNLWVLVRRTHADLVYSRHLAGALFAARRGLPVVYEAHGVPSGGLQRRMMRALTASAHLSRIVAISRSLAGDLLSAGLGVDEARLLVAHDAATPQSHHAAVRLGPGPHIGYVGNLYPGKGAELVVAVARRLPEYRFHIVGGTPADLRRRGLSDLPANLELHGFVPPGALAGLYAAFDVLLLPPQRLVVGATGRTDISRWMSPLKVFEYMAARRPIVASDLPVLQEVLVDRKNALLVPPDDVDAWVESIRMLIERPDLARDLATAAFDGFMREHTYRARAARVLEGL